MGCVRSQVCNFLPSINIPDSGGDRVGAVDHLLQHDAARSCNLSLNILHYAERLSESSTAVHEDKVQCEFDKNTIRWLAFKKHLTAVVRQKNNIIVTPVTARPVKAWCYCSWNLFTFHPAGW